MNRVDKLGASPLLLAAQEGNLKIVKLLVKKGANINQANAHGHTALHLATLKSLRKCLHSIVLRMSPLDPKW